MSTPSDLDEQGHAPDQRMLHPYATLIQSPGSLLIASFKLDGTFYTKHAAIRYTKHITEKFQRIKSVGKGANGEVHLMRGGIDGKRVRALKEIKDSKDLEDPEIISLIALNQFEHHFTRFYGWWKQDNALCLVTEYMEGGDLHKHIHAKPKFIPEDEAQKVAKKIIEAAVIMHSMGIVHRDLKPRNILLANKNGDPLDIRIGDMGISKTIDTLSNASSAGTQGYKAPEVIRRDVFLFDDEKKTASPVNNNLNYAPDMWSVGCVIFATLTGESPYPNDLPIPENDAGFPTDILQYHEVSELGINFIKSLVMVDSAKRMTAKTALEHRWLLLVDCPPGES